VSQSQTTPLVLGPGERILDQNLHAHIDEIEPLSPGDLLKIASFYQVADTALSNHLVLMAMKVISKEQVLQNTPPPAVGRAGAFAVAASAKPLNEWQDQVEDFLNGSVDPEDRNTIFRGVNQPKDVRWLPFSAALSGLGLLIETTTLNDDMYVIGVAPDPESLSSDD
jgi:hypothetical protein